MPIIFYLALTLTAVYHPLLSSTIISDKELKIRHFTLTKEMVSHVCYLYTSCAKHFWEAWVFWKSYAISGYHSNELSSVNNLLERKLRCTSWTSEQPLISVYLAYSVTTDKICDADMWSTAWPQFIHHISGTHNHRVYEIELVCFVWENDASASIHLNVSVVCSSQNVQKALNFTPRALQHLGCHRSNCTVDSCTKFNLTTNFGRNTWSFT
jgi:hypothetical protein